MKNKPYKWVTSVTLTRMNSRGINIKATLGAFVAESEDDAIAQAHKEAHENPKYEGWCIACVIAAPVSLLPNGKITQPTKNE